MQLPSNDTDGAVSILELFTLEDPVHGRSAARRVLAEVKTQWPGDVGRLWWKWFTEASQSLGLKAKAIDCSLEEACNLAKDHAQFVCFKPGGDNGHANAAEWFAIQATSRRKYSTLFCHGIDEPIRKQLTDRGLKKKLSEFAQDERLRCVVIQPCEVTSAEYTSQQTMRPFERLLKLMKPEAADIWIVIVFAFVVSLLMLATPVAVEALVNTVAFGRFLQPIIILALILLTFLGFQGAIRGLQTYVVEIVQRRIFARVAADLAYRLPRTEAEATDGKYMPELVNRFFDVVGVQKVGAQLLLDGLGLALSTFIGMAVLAFYHPWLLGFDIFLLGSIVIIVFLLGRGAVPSAIKESKHKYYMASWLEDVARNSGVFHGDGGSDFALERTDRLIHEYLVARRKHFRIVMRQVLFALGLQAVASTVLLGLGGWLVVAGELTLGQLVAAELIVTVIVGSFAKFGKHMESFYDLLASIDKLGALFDIPTERQDGMLGVQHSGPSAIQLNSVSYAYQGCPSIIDGLSVEIESGSNTAILAGSGMGKSTLMELLYGLRSPVAGHLSIDGCDPRDMRPDMLRSMVALARREVFQGSIEDNVHLHRQDVRAGDVREVLEELGLLDIILKFDEGFSTILTSDGRPLSDNQIALLSIARAAVVSPRLLLIDGLLDTLGGRELEIVLSFLQDPKRRWTLVVTTCRDDIAELMDEVISLGDASPLPFASFRERG